MLKDSEAQAHLDREGWVILNFFQPEEIGELVARYEAIHCFPIEGMFFSNRSPDEDYKQRVQEFLRNYYANKIERFFLDMVWIDGVFIVKAPGAGEFSNHQDWSLVDERKARTLGVWAPMLDVDGSNGTFCVLPGSHRFHETYRSPTISSIYAKDELWEVIDRHRKVLPVKRGQAVVFDHALIHATTANQSTKRRGAVFFGLKPKSAEMRFYWQDPREKKVEAFHIEPEFLYQYDYQSRPQAKSLGHLSWSPPHVEPMDLETLIAHHQSVHPSKVKPTWWQRLLGGGR